MPSNHPSHEGGERTAIDFPRIPLSPDARVWLEAVYAKLRNGKKVVPSELLVELWGKIPEDYDYRNIDQRLILHGVSITLLGVLHVDPKTDLPSKIDRVIRCVREQIIRNPSIEDVAARQVAEETGLTEEDVALAFSLMRWLGRFWNGASGDERGYTQVHINYEEVKREYLRYKGVETLINKCYEESKPAPHQDQASEVKETLAPQLMGAATDTRNVFVVHGRNLDARNSLFRFLRALGLRPLEWSQAVKETGKASPFIGEVLDAAFSKAQAIVVLLTPDDEARLRVSFRGADEPTYETELTGQARPNVLFEAGMAMGHNPDRTIIVELGSVRPFSDIAGRHTVRLSNDSAARQELAQRLETAGCAVDLSGRDWHTEGNFNLQPVRPQKIADTSVRQVAVAPPEGDVYTSLAARYNLNIIERDTLLTLFKRIEALSANQVASELGTQVEVVEPAINSLRNKLMVRVIENTMGDDYKITSIGIETARSILLGK